MTSAFTLGRACELTVPGLSSQNIQAGENPAARRHLLVLVGFTASGDPVINDPSCSTDAAVRHVYTRRNSEKVWQGSTGGIAYVIHPKEVPLPAQVAGAMPNW